MTIYAGWVRHRRHDGVPHEFRYPIALRYEQVGERSWILHAPPRWGVGFNPVRFEYGFAEDGELESVVAEVTSTPWGERRRYELDPRGGTLPKTMHVSPFQPMEQSYSWRVTAPGDRLLVHLENHVGGRRVFDATLSLRRAPQRRRATRPLTILARIYLQALRLRLKGAPYHPRPA